MDRTKYMTMARAMALFWAGFWAFLAIAVFLIGSGKEIYGILSLLALIGICYVSWKEPRRGSIVFLSIGIVFLIFGIILTIFYPAGPGGIFFTILTSIFPLGAAFFFNRARKLDEPAPQDTKDQDD